MKVVTADEALFLLRLLIGGVLAGAAVWVSFGPELSRALARLGIRRDAATVGPVDALDMGSDSQRT